MYHQNATVNFKTSKTNPYTIPTNLEVPQRQIIVIFTKGVLELDGC